jgi:hypothetical protein
VKGSTPIHPFLLAAFPVLFLLAENLGETELPEALPPLVLSIAVTALAFGIVTRILHDSRRAALLVSLAVVTVLLFGHAENLLAAVRLTEGKVLVGWLLLSGIVGLVILRTNRDLAGPTIAVNVLAAVLTINALASIALHGIRSSTLPNPGAAAASPSAVLPAATPASAVDPSARDIYYIVVEDYGSQRTVRDTLGLPDDGFFDWLDERGFDTLSDTRSNYGRTPLSLASSLNMTYLDALAARYGPDWIDYAPIVDMVRAPAVADFLHARGYTFVQVGSQFRLTATSHAADVNPVYQDTSDFAGVFYDTTILPAIVHRLGLDDGRDGRRKNYDAVVWQLDQVRRVVDRPGPKFVFVHIFLPHHPYVVDADGRYVPRDVDAGRTVIEQQATQWGYVGRELERLIDPLLAGPDAEDPIIVVTTDEGPNPDGMPTVGGDLAWGSATDAQLDQKFSIFAGYYLPGVETSGLYPTMSSVNTFRLIFGLYFGADLPLLPDRNWIHRDKHHPFDLTDVTDRLDSFAGGAGGGAP